MLKISETFQSMQGEGKSAGQLANFIRVSGCPLSCVWCDTPYTWDWAKYSPKEETHLMSISNIIDTLNVKDFRLTVLTGGEPLLYQEKLLDLIWAIWEHDNINFGSQVMRFEMETAGSLEVHPKLFRLAQETFRFQFNVSPKLENSGNKKKWPVNDKFMEDMFVLGEGTPNWPMIKFVVTRPGDFIEVGQFCAYYHIPRHAVWIMAEGITGEKQRENMEWVVNHCLINRYNYSPRLHTLVWDNMRGV